MSLILSGTDGLSDVDGSAATPAIRGTDANTGIFFPAADTIAFAEGGAECARFDSSGNFGLGVTPSYRLDVSKATAGDVARFTNGGASNKSLFVYTDATYAAIATGVGASGNGIALDAVTNKMLFTTASTNQMALDASGNLLVGTTTKFGGGLSGLDLNSAGATGITFGKSATPKSYFYLTSDTASFVWSTASGTVASVVSSTNGVTLTNGATSWASLSDERKKDIIEPIVDAATKVSSLRSVIGKYKTEEDGIRRAMLIAQDVQAVLPEAVTEKADGDLLLQYTEIIPLLVAAIKEQSALITTLTDRITALENK